MLLALFWAVLAMRGARGGAPVDPDAARHAMNGVLIHDMVRSGQVTSPVQFAVSFYEQYPTVSLPYHPPLFPVIEAIFYAVFGVSHVAARLAVAVSVFASAILMYALILKTCGSAVVASAVTFAFLSLGESRLVAADVMLEFPSLAFALAALYVIRRFPVDDSLRNAVLFSVLAGMAVWAKQQTIFLVAVPFLLLAFTRRWNVLFRPPIWVSAVIVSAAAAGLLMVSKVSGISVHNPNWRRAAPLDRVVHHIGYYSNAIVSELGWPLVVVLLAGLVLLVRNTRFRKSTDAPEGLFAAWLIAAVLLLLLLPPWAARYLFYVYAPLFTIAIIGFDRFAQNRYRKHPLTAAAGFLICALVLLNARGRHPFLLGPDEAAQIIAFVSPSRILYCGYTVEGPLSFALRSHDPNRKMTLLRAEKVPQQLLTPSRLMEFVSAQGIDVVVFEELQQQESRCGSASEAALKLQRLAFVPIQGSLAKWNGEFHIFRVTPGSELRSPTHELKQRPGGRELDVRLETR